MSQAIGQGFGGAWGAGLRVSGALAAAFVAISTSASAQPAQQASPEAQSQSPLAQSLFNDERNRAMRYRTPDGAVRFVFDRSGGRVALVRFEGDPEVHVLRPVAAAGGDEIYRTEDGNIALRLSRHGYITVYTRTNTLGAPAEEVAEAAPLTPEAVARAAFEARLQQLQAQAARRLGEQVTFVTPQMTDNYNAGVVLDAAERAAEGLVEGRITVVRRVVITIGAQPGAQLRGEQLIIQVAPQMGYAGRPSSMTIRNVATGERQGPTQ